MQHLIICAFHLSVSGCVNSVPKLRTFECQPGGGDKLTIHGLDFKSMDMEYFGMMVSFGKLMCVDTKIVNPWVISCTLPAGSGEGHAFNAKFLKNVENR